MASFLQGAIAFLPIPSFCGSPFRILKPEAFPPLITEHRSLPLSGLDT